MHWGDWDVRDEPAERPPVSPEKRVALANVEGKPGKPCRKRSERRPSFLHLLLSWGIKLTARFGGNCLGLHDNDRN
jgi:hypothetical protein